MSTDIQKYAFVLLRGVTGIIFFMHGIARIYYGTLPGFGEYLNAQGFMIGYPLAWLITIGEIVSGCMLAIGFKVKYCTIFHAIVLITGMILIHIPQGWFTVGQNSGGVEYSSLLLAVLFYIFTKNPR
ncbi:MAG: DoxX family protein [Cyclobacteriaceae bacterium]